MSHDAIADAAHLAGQISGIGARRAGAGDATSNVIASAIEELVGLVLRHKDPAALARDLVAEAAHKAAMEGAVNAALVAENVVE